MHVDVEIEGGEAIALRVREELARRRLSRQWLADEVAGQPVDAREGIVGTSAIYPGDRGPA